MSSALGGIALAEGLKYAFTELKICTKADLGYDADDNAGEEEKDEAGRSEERSRKSCEERSVATSTCCTSTEFLALGIRFRWVYMLYPSRCTFIPETC